MHFIRMILLLAVVALMSFLTSAKEAVANTLQTAALDCSASAPPLFSDVPSVPPAAEFTRQMGELQCVTLDAQDYATLHVTFTSCMKLCPCDCPSFTASSINSSSPPSKAYALQCDRYDFPVT